MMDIHSQLLSDRKTFFIIIISAFYAILKTAGLKNH